MNVIRNVFFDLLISHVLNWKKMWVNENPSSGCILLSSTLYIDDSCAFGDQVCVLKGRVPWSYPGRDEEHREPMCGVVHGARFTTPWAKSGTTPGRDHLTVAKVIKMTKKQGEPGAPCLLSAFDIFQKENKGEGGFKKLKCKTQECVAWQGSWKNFLARACKA